MRRSSAAMVLVILVAGSPRGAPAQKSADSTVLCAFVDEYLRVFNTKEAPALARFFDNDADMVMGNGPYSRGRRAIEAWWRAHYADRPYFSDPDLRIRFVIDGVRMITPDAALRVLPGEHDRILREHELLRGQEPVPDPTSGPTSPIGPPPPGRVPGPAPRLGPARSPRGGSSPGSPTR